MIDSEKLAKIRSGEAFEPKGSRLMTELDVLSVTELLDLRSEVEKRLPATHLKGMDLEKELVLQYQKVVALQDEVLSSQTAPANQQAQVANAVTATLQQLVAMQTKYHTAERLKEIESRLIRCLEKVPDQYLREFFDWYEAQTV